MGTIIKNSISKSVLLYSFNLNNVRYHSLFYQSTCLGGVAWAKAKFSLQARAYSTSSKDGSSSGCGASALFSDADKDKLDILKYVKGKAGIYLWANKINGKKYVGSSVDLRRRLLEYYNVNRLLNEKSMPVCVALLKYGYHNFSVTILEICDIDIYSLISREKHFFEVYSGEYNILKTPGSPSRGSGWKHSEASIEKMRIAASKRSPETLAKLSAVQSRSIKVEVTDMETNTTTVYHAIRAAARILGIDKRYIEHYIFLNKDEPVFGRYTFKLLDSKDKSPNLINVAKVQKSFKKVEVTNVDTKEVTIYPSIGTAARALGYRQASISLYLKENRTNPFKGTHLFKLV